jgi:hypothetical protein
VTRARDVANIDGVLTTKGDIYAATAAATPARLGVGNNGETLVADSSASTGLRYQNNFAAGKNKIINGDFFVNQRNFTSVTTSGTYTFDRWFTDANGGTFTYTPQVFTPGAAPVAGYEGTNFLRCVTSGQSGSNYAAIIQRIENVRTLAGQTATVSFWAKAGSGTPSILTQVVQRFGSGGSSAVVTNLTAQVTSTSWARYSVTFSVPSISGKTVGTSSNLEFNFFFSFGDGSIGVQNNTFELWGVQVEAANTATAFQTATGTIQGELAACQRYYARYADEAQNNAFCNTSNYSTTLAYGTIPFIVQMRIAPTIAFSAGNAFQVLAAGAGTTTTAMAAAEISTKIARIGATVASGLTTGQGSFLQRTAATGFMEASAEL